jgi:hypothetical protein
MKRNVVSDVNAKQRERKRKFNLVRALLSVRSVFLSDEASKFSNHRLKVLLDNIPTKKHF